MRHWNIKHNVIGIVICMIFLFSIFAAAQQNKVSAKKFEITYTVKYNAITLQEAADLELVFRKLYKDACRVDVKVKEAQNDWGVVTLTGDIWLADTVITNEHTLLGITEDDLSTHLAD